MCETEKFFCLGMNIKPEYMMLNIKASTDVEAIKILAENFFKAGAVKDTFVPAILLREKNFCTGLQFEEAGIAIPHTDAIHVNYPAVAIGKLENPVVFQSMGAPNTPVKVEIMFMLAIKEPHKQIEFLQLLMTKFQEENLLRRLMKCNTAEELTEKFIACLV
ncbi:PTS system, galactitol-specific IIA component [Propionispira arboris]|uniref:PTS system, galactitol-specific IIA component n=1 Tax=Propionispira arboris TaxID=84035 RepID=A0A1H7CY00_9FIRM|nr:PTS sugar transporter subunit IIA [Propionispira arboris]SEJ94479.1 PTS system, galactitol-specific IIA component [Propionispira arboris]